MLGDVTEAQADKACRTLKRAIDAAENSNQAGENFVVAAAAGEDLLEVLERLVSAVTTRSLRGRDHVPSMREEQGAMAFARAAIAKVTGGAA